ncbi:MAG: hypothetical protein OXC44_07785 [Proteobacteria bacterium]|nr:hypothetical protein [Pseudomonadota bacterium]
MTFYRLRHKITVFLASFSIVSIALQLSSCRSPSAFEYDKADSSLHGAYDGTYSLVLQKHGEDLHFVTCLGTPQQLNASSCVAALKLSDGSAVKYDFFTKDALEAEDLQEIDNLKAELAADYLAEHGSLPENFRIATTGVGAAALGGWFSKAKLNNPAMSHHVNKVVKLLNQDQTLLAKMAFSDLFRRDAFKGNEHLDLLEMFNEPRHLDLLKTQAGEAWGLLKKRATDLLDNGRSINGISKDMTQFYNDVTFWQFNDMADVFVDYDDVMSNLDPAVAQQRMAQQRQRFAEEKKAKRAKDAAARQNKARYDAAAHQARQIKRKIAMGEFDEGVVAWRALEDHWMLDEVDKIEFGRDVAPHRTNPVYVNNLKAKFTSLQNKVSQNLKNGVNVYSLIGEKGELHRVSDALDFAKLQDRFSAKNRKAILEGFERQAKELDLLTRPVEVADDLAKAAAVKKSPGRAVAGKVDEVAAVLDSTVGARPLSPSANIAVSKSGKVISSAGGPFAGVRSSFAKAGTYLGWGLSLVAGVVIIFAIVDNASSQSVVDLEVFKSASQKPVPFIPVSVYDSYWPSLNTLDSSISLKVPSVPSVLKTLALHASGGNIALAADMSYCLPVSGSASASSSAACYQVAIAK